MVTPGGSMTPEEVRGSYEEFLGIKKEMIS